MNFKGRVTIDEDEIKAIIAHHVATHMRLAIQPSAIIWVADTSDKVVPTIKVSAYIDLDTNSGLGVKPDGKQQS